MHKKLETKRDELAYDVYVHYLHNFTEDEAIAASKSFENGFDAAYSELLPKIEILKDALKTAHQNACGCCDSADEVKRHCYEAINKVEEME